MKPEVAIELYKLFKGQSTESFRFHQQVLQRYVAFTVAVLAASVAGIFKMKGLGAMGLILLIGPFINIVVSILGIGTCNSFYNAALKNVSVFRKLEYILDIEDYSKNDIDGLKKPFPNDKYLFPQDWVNQKFSSVESMDNYKTSALFIEEKCSKGVNRYARWTFIFIISINLVLAMAIAIIAIQ
jgi:hypothetical protein